MFGKVARLKLLDFARLSNGPHTPRELRAQLCHFLVERGHTVASIIRQRCTVRYNVAVVMEIKKKLQDEIATLEYELHVELPKEILKARAHGDLSENAEYHAAKDRQGFVNARLGQLKKRLAELSMVDFSKIPHGKVGLGSIVVVLDTKKEEEITYNLVTSEEADAANGKISTTSPIGRSLLGKEVGDIAKVTSPGGSKELEILKLTTIHDTAG
jgi:transcription elongation factor GreA